MCGMKLGREKIAFDKRLDGIEGDAREEGDVFEGWEDISGCCLDLGAFRYRAWE
jgi:hypothetical protein